MLYLKMFILSLVIQARCDFKMNIVEALSKHFFCGCVYVVHSSSGLQNEALVIKWSKVLTTQVSAISAEDVVRKSIQFHCRRNRPLVVIPNENDTLKFLEQVYLPSAIWLTFKDSNQNTGELNVPFDCEFYVASHKSDLIMLSEVHKVSPSHPLRQRNFGNWSSSRGLLVSGNGLYNRRANLEGLVIKSAILENALLNVVKKVNNKPMVVSRYVGNVWNTLQEILNFRADYYWTPDNNFGTRLGNGNWSGMIGEIVNQKVNGGLNAVMYNKERLEAVDFIYPFMRTRNTLVIKRPRTTELVWSSFLMPFSKETWLFVVLLVVCSAFTMFFLDKVWKRNSHIKSTTGTVDAFWIVLGIFCSQDQQDTGYRPMYSRISVLTMNIAGIVIATYYSAFLISYITLKRYEIPFRDLQGFMNDGTYTLGTPKNTGYYTLFKYSSDPLMQEAYHKYLTVEKNLPKNFLHSLEWVCNKKKFVTLMPEFFAISRGFKKTCDIQNLPEPISTSDASIIFGKRSPYTGIFRDKINRMKSSGILMSLWQRNVQKMRSETSEEYVSVSLEQMTLALSVLAAGILLSLLVLLGELLLHYHLDLCRTKKSKAYYFYK